MVPSLSLSTPFTLFSKLPLELRRQVWTSALPASRTITLKPEINETLEDGSLPVYLINTALQTPNVFHVNNESRTEALMNYKPAFQAPSNNRDDVDSDTHDKMDVDHDQPSKYAYLDFSSDTIYINFNMPMGTSINSPIGRKRSLSPISPIHPHAPQQRQLSALETLAVQEGHHIRKLAIHFGAPFSPWFTVDVAKPMRQCLEPLLAMRCLEEVTMVWMEESDPANYFMNANQNAESKKLAVGGEWDREYLEDLESERKRLQDALDEAESQREDWKAPMVKLLVEQ